VLFEELILTKMKEVEEVKEIPRLLWNSESVTLSQELVVLT
jgi:hypothetical protein